MTRICLTKITSSSESLESPIGEKLLWGSATESFTPGGITSDLNPRVLNGRSSSDTPNSLTLKKDPYAALLLKENTIQQYVFHVIPMTSLPQEVLPNDPLLASLCCRHVVLNNGHLFCCGFLDLFNNGFLSTGDHSSNRQVCEKHTGVIKHVQLSVRVCGLKVVLLNTFYLLNRNTYDSISRHVEVQFTLSRFLKRFPNAFRVPGETFFTAFVPRVTAFTKPPRYSYECWMHDPVESTL